MQSLSSQLSNEILLHYSVNKYYYKYALISVVMNEQRFSLKDSWYSVRFKLKVIETI